MNTIILLVEDERDVVEVISRGLETVKDFTVKVCTTLDSALGFLKANTVDAIVCDLNLPDSNGIETLMAIQAMEPEIPIVVLTGADADYKTILHRGAQDFFQKGSLQIRDLERSIRYAIERHRVRRLFIPLEAELKDTEELITRINNLAKRGVPCRS